MNRPNHDRLLEQLSEVSIKYPNLNFGYLIVSPYMFTALYKECHLGPYISNFARDSYNQAQGFALSTNLGQLFLKVEVDLADDDFVLMDHSKNRFSYQHNVVSQLLEDILLNNTI